MKHAAVKNHIIETASQLFYQKGYNSTGINEIIAESGIAKATLYNHFKSKEDICIAYLRHKNTTFLTEIEAFANAKRKGKNRVLGFFDFLQEFFQDKDFNGCWCIRTVAEIPKDNERVKQEIQTLKADFIALIETVISENLSIESEKEMASLARKTYLLYEGAVGESHLHGDDWPIRESRSLCAQIIA